ncbi:unnamed protein product [Urochloa decumbens]|uniref:Uncharacterized protein n=1 Tax=Urochloa decumbens TaxID=240449 RepID=A0ABC8ZY17_9POAL
MDPARIALLFVLSSALLAAAAASINMGEGVVIGVLDDGIDAGHPSFGDEGMPPPPASWRGRCKHSGVTACNNKLVGAREFTRHLRRPAGRPPPGAGTHGTHASSIAAGAPVLLAAGGETVVSGVAPRAHLAFYQVCAGRGCSRGPIMNAVEAALADGVDVLSMSLGDDGAAGFHEDPVVAATFSAVMRGVVVCAAAGNNGASSPAGSVANDAPWILTVGASSPQQSVAAFSSRGPSRNNGGVLKPDIVGPGVNILAAVPRSRRRGDGQSFAALSGTSMSAPHVSGVAALVKSAHPSWSPAAIKSAIMTTADAASVADEASGGAPASYLAMGAGLVDAARAVDPGLVYDISPEEYFPYLCGLGYTDDQVNRIIFPAPAVTCAEMESTEARDLNTPSVMVALAADTPAVTVRRAVTNVGAARSVYRVEVSAPEGVSVTVTPGELRFDEVSQKASFTVTVERVPGGALTSEDLGAQVAWVSEEHVVRIPISISAARF